MTARSCRVAKALLLLSSGFLRPAVQMLLQQGLPRLAVILRAPLGIMVLVLLALSCAGPAELRAIHTHRQGCDRSWD